MEPLGFDHVNLRTARLAEMVAFYTEVLGLVEGWRPPFPFPGAWLYLGDQAIVHLVGVNADEVALPERPFLEHFAIRAKGLSDFRALLARRGIDGVLAEVPGAGIVQVNIRDPDGTHVHVDFEAAELQVAAPGGGGTGTRNPR